MVIHQSGQFWSALRSSRLLPAAEIDQLEENLDCRTQDPAACARILVENKVLTSYQAQQLIEGLGESLVLGPYKILDRLGSGGMGHVYRAEHQVMDRIVAIKVAGARSLATVCSSPSNGARRSDSDGETDPLPRFQREIRVSARLNHPNIVAAFDAGEAGGRHYLAMEYVEGKDLDRLVAETGPLPVPLACECIRQACLGLQYAHEQGLVHRDIKPANLLLQTSAGATATATPVLKILDLGLARFRHQQETESPEFAPAGSDSGLGGTPDYLPPELAHNWAAADIRSDLYSLGCTFYFLLAGQPPFSGGAWTEKLIRHHSEDPRPIQEVRPEVPDRVAVVLHRLLAKAPSDRYREPAEVASELAECLTTCCKNGDRHGILPSQPPSLQQVRNEQETKPEHALRHVMSGTVDTPLSVDFATWSDFGSGVRTPPHGTVPVASQPEPSRERPSSRLARFRWWPWPTALMATMVLGLFGAWLVRESLPRPKLSFESPSGTSPRANAFIVDGMDASFLSLEAALDSARDGDTITIHGNGPFLCGPLKLMGKRLCLKAGEGSQPTFRFVRHPRSRVWHVPLHTDRPLSMEGIGFIQEVETGTPLIVSSGASLRLHGCRFHAPRTSGVIVCQDVRELEIQECQFRADSLAVCVECPEGKAINLRLLDNTMNLTDSSSAAISLWSPEARVTGEVRLEMEHNSVDAGRILSLKNLPRHLTLDVRRNDLHFREALLAINGKLQPISDFAAWQQKGSDAP